MTLEFAKGTKENEKVCFLHTGKIDNPTFPLWITKKNFEEIKQLMDW